MSECSFVSYHLLLALSKLCFIFESTCSDPLCCSNILKQTPNATQRFWRTYFDEMAEMVSRSWHFAISTMSRLWEKYHQHCKTMNVHLIHLQHYLNNRLSLYVINRYCTQI